MYHVSTIEYILTLQHVLVAVYHALHHSLSVYYYPFSLARSLIVLLVVIGTGLGHQDPCKHYGKYDEVMCTHHAILVMLLQLTFWNSLELELLLHRRLLHVLADHQILKIQRFR